MKIDELQEQKNAAYWYAKQMLYELAALTGGMVQQPSEGDLDKVEFSFERYKRAYVIYQQMQSTKGSG